MGVTAGGPLARGPFWHGMGTGDAAQYVSDCQRACIIKWIMSVEIGYLNGNAESMIKLGLPVSWQYGQ